MNKLKELKKLIENAEAKFVECIHKKKSLSEKECKLMNDILELKEEIYELLDEEREAK